MKTKFIFFGMLCFNLSFGQSNFNQTAEPLETSIFDPIPALGSEIFRFRSGLVTQLDSGLNFDFTNQWFALGRVSLGPAATQVFYGARFQTPNNALVMGYTSLSPNNPRIEWIGDGINTGNLEFKVGTSFGTPGVPGVNRFVASMNSDGSTVFGEDFIEPSFTGTKVKVFNNAIGFDTAIGIDAVAGNGNQNNIAVRGFAATLDPFGAGIYGTALNAFNQLAGFFDGNVFGSNLFRPSDRRIKLDPRLEESLLPRLALLKPVNYTFDKITELNLPEGIQHGFIAQDVEKIFPDLVRDISKPVFDKNGKTTSTFTFKSVDYLGMISMLVGGIQELNTKIETLEKTLAEKDSKSSERKGFGASSENTKGFFMEQNIPNPFGDQTIIKYQLPEGTTTAEIMVFDLNGRLIKSYAINKNQSQQTIKASEIGSGIFIYSLVQNGQELMTKKMIVK